MKMRIDESGHEIPSTAVDDESFAQSRRSGSDFPYAPVLHHYVMIFGDLLGDTIEYARMGEDDDHGSEAPVFFPVPLAVVVQCVPSLDCWNCTVTLLAEANL